MGFHLSLPDDPHELRIAFGPYAGKKISELSEAYLMSLWYYIDLTPAMRNQVEYVLQFYRDQRPPDSTVGTHTYRLLYFGRYIGYRPEEVPIDYLRWMIDYIPIGNHLNDYIRTILTGEMLRRGVTFLEPACASFNDGSRYG